MPHELPPTHRLPPQSSSEIDARIDRLARRAEEDLPEAVFHKELLAELVEATAALGAAIWRADGESLSLAAQLHLSHLADESEQREPRRQAALGDVLRSGQPRTLAARDDPRDGAEPAAAAVLVPWRATPEEGGVLEVHLRAEVSGQALAGQARFARVVADLLAIFQRRRRLSLLQRRDQTWQAIDHFARAIHRDGRLAPTAYEIANEGRRLIQCDRVTVLVRRRRQWRVVAVSGADTANRRAATLRHLERLTAAVASVGEPLWYAERTNEAESIPPEIEEPLHDYVDLASTRLAGFCPLTLPPPTGDCQPAASADAGDTTPFGMVVVEQFDRLAPEELRERTAAVCRHAAPAVRQALDLESLPLYSVSSLLHEARWFRRLAGQPTLLLIAAAVAAGLAALGIVPATLRIEASGTLQPEVRRQVFAPDDGIVESLFVHEAGEKVARGETLLRLRNLQLQYEGQRLWGELETARKQLSSIEAERLAAGRASREDLRQAALRAAEEETLKKKIEGLSLQQTLLERLEAELQIASPIDGEVLTWDVKGLLESRPVARGQLLLTVADLTGAWVLELEIPDDRIAHVLAAMQSSGQPLAVRFILATAPEEHHTGRLERVSPATDSPGGQSPTVSAVVRPDNQAAMRLLRPGATVTAKIDCGRRSVLYVWFHGLLHVTRSRLLF
ncbi:MAG: efflux RND transporter periplasmic adaptor subunit [Thermoguttaceae bacterium]|jgi:hypothetical protein